MKDSNSIVKNTVVLVVIALILSTLLGITNQLTKDRIIEQNEKVKNDAYMAVYADAASFEENADLTAQVEAAATEEGISVDEALVAKDAGGQDLGVVLNLTTPEGYGGDIILSIGVSADGTLTGMRVVSNGETAGLGANCTQDWFQEQFSGIQAPEVAFTKTGKSAPNEIDAISSATITTTACTNAVNAGLAFAYGYLGLN